MDRGLGIEERVVTRLVLHLHQVASRLARVALKSRSPRGLFASQHAWSTAQICQLLDILDLSGLLVEEGVVKSQHAMPTAQICQLLNLGGLLVEEGVVERLALHVHQVASRLV